MTLYKNLSNKTRKKVREQLPNKIRALYSLKNHYDILRITETMFSVTKPDCPTNLFIDVEKWDWRVQKIIRVDNNTLRSETKYGKVYGVLRLRNFVNSVFKEEQK